MREHLKSTDTVKFALKDIVFVKKKYVFKRHTFLHDINILNMIVHNIVLSNKL